MCTRDKEFTIKGTQDCLARGFDRTGFFEVDTGEQRAWTVQLTDTAEGPQQRPLTPGTPMLPTPGRQSAVATAARTRANETPAPHQDRRHARPRLRQRRDDRAAVRGRRRRVPHQHEPHAARPHARAGRDDPRRSRRITAGRSASWSICRGRSCASAPSPAARPCSTTARPSRFDADPDARRRQARAPAASGNLRGRQSRPHAAARRRQDPARRDRGDARARSSPASRSAASSPTARASACPTPSLPFSALTAEGPLRPRRRARRRHRLDRRCPSCSGPRTSPRPRRSRAAAPP